MLPSRIALAVLLQETTLYRHGPPPAMVRNSQNVSRSENYCTRGAVRVLLNAPRLGPSAEPLSKGPLPAALVLTS